MYRIRSLLGGLVLPGLLSVCARAGDAPVAALPADGVVVSQPEVVQVIPLSLGAAQAHALERQPLVAAANASLVAAAVRRDAIHSLRVPNFVARDLPVRKQQSDLGVAVADANLRLAQMNALYAVNYSYISYLYILEQERIAADAIPRLLELRTRLLTPPDQDKGQAPKELNPEKLPRDERINFLQVETSLNLARTRQAEAQMAAERALSALREAMALPPDCPLAIARHRLMDVNLQLDKKVLLDLACARRPELVQASLGLEVAGLETLAQAKTSALAFRMNTFASGSDIHANALPEGRFDNEYRPAAVGPEYPVTLNGHRKKRVEQAEAWEGRAGTVVDRTRSLIALEVDQTYLRWLDASKRLAGYRAAYRTAEARVQELREDVVKGDNFAGGLPQLIKAGTAASQLRYELNKARYEMLLGLAQLERVTAGAFCAKLDQAADAPDEAALAIAAAQKVIEARKKQAFEEATDAPIALPPTQPLESQP
jgi:hypothetical protein